MKRDIRVWCASIRSPSTSVLAWNEELMLKYTWKLQIGDWSHDGHGICDDFLIQSNFSLHESHEVYEKAKKEYPEICPEKFADEWNKFINNKEFKAWLDAGLVDEMELEDFSPENFAIAVLRYIKLGDENFEFKLLPDEPSFNSYKNGIGFGYGLYYS